ncbi:MAG: IS200/IS605 family transposase [Gemmatimonadales bacterium]
MRHRLLVHLTWTTRERQPRIDAGVARFLARFLPAVARQERAEVLALGLVTTHVHLLLRLHPATVISRLVQRLKGGSAVLATRENHTAPGRPLRWAKGYNIESVSWRAAGVVASYIRDQAVRHPDQAIKDWSGDIASATERAEPRL